MTHTCKEFQTLTFGDLNDICKAVQVVGVGEFVPVKGGDLSSTQKRTTIKGVRVLKSYRAIGNNLETGTSEQSGVFLFPFLFGFF